MIINYNGSFYSCNDVGDDLLVGVPEVRFPVDVIDGRGEVKLFTHPSPTMQPWPSTWQSWGAMLTLILDWLGDSKVGEEVTYLLVS